MNGAAMILAEMGRGWDHGDMMGNGTGAGWWVLMTLAMAIFLAALIALVVWIARGQSDSSRADDARELLRRRLADGSITPEEFEQRRELLDRS